VIAHDTLDARGAVPRTGYLHLRSASGRNGERVSRGQKIGEVGLFPCSGGMAHVHWRVWHGSETVDPETFARYGPLDFTYPLAC